VFLGEREAHFVIGSTVLTTRLIEGEFPNYRQLLPEEYPCRLHSEDKSELLDALRRVKLLVKDSLTPVRMAFGPNGVVLTVSQESGQATEEVEGKYEGTEMTIAFNPEYLIQGIEAVSGSEVILSTVEPKKPATIRGSENDTFLYLLMPVRVA
jgi:DNA polymerase-3 subunit beta